MNTSSYLLLIAVLIFPTALFAQRPGQTVRGTITDAVNQDPLIGANILISWNDGSVGAITDENGTFLLEEIPVGRINVSINYLGYEGVRDDGILLNASRELVLEYKLNPVSVTLDAGVEVVAYKSFESTNELAPLARSITAEEIERQPTNANDPGRTFMSYPGVQPSRDTRSDVVIRGNSSVGLLWRLEGIDIPNPNHFARRGTSGGGITIFSLSMLDRSEFLTGAFPGEYGNAFAGAFDAKFRKGSDESREYTFRVGLLGLDFATEGPFKKEKSSYLLNYRYSTLGILNNLGFNLVGERVDNTFQDLSFNLNFKGKDGNSNLNFWGIGGLSNETMRTSDPVEEWDSFSDQTYYEFITNMGAMGLKYNLITNDNAYLQVSAAAMGQQIVVQDDTVSIGGEHTLINREDYLNGRYSVSAFYKVRPSNAFNYQIGAFASNLFFDLQHDSLSLVSFEEQQVLDVQDQTFLLQPYLQFQWKPNERFITNAGVHSMFLTLNNSWSVEPRLSFKYNLSEKDNLVLAYGLHSRMVPIGSYFTQVRDDLGNISQPNLDLELIKSHHLILAYQRLLGNELRLRTELYYQYLFDVPMGAAPGSTYWTLNDIQGYSTVALISEGVGRNYGIDLLLEKALGTDGLFFIITGSLFNSQFKTFADRDIWFDTRYNTNVAASLTLGKEFPLKGGDIFSLGLKMLYNGGMPITPLKEGAVVSNPYYPPLDESAPFSDRIEDYFRPDARIAYRHNKKTTWLLSLDIQNVIARRNVDGLNRVYDPDLNAWVDRVQSSLTPILSFQIDI
ncbi:MAG: TonB-dependent receptor [Bacteroidetes bacterium]|nr:TonB-dependent receptor [Bacteroidota bacterium]